MIVLFTDFGLDGPYVGQMKGVLAQYAQGLTVIDLLHNAPRCNPLFSSYLLAAYSANFPAESLFLCVVDPGVGSERRPVALYADQKWFVGPDNGLLDVVAARAIAVQWWEITWRPEHLSCSFHGRDLFAPITAFLACGGDPQQRMRPIVVPQCQAQAAGLAKVLYLDHYGNAITGLSAAGIATSAQLKIKAFTLTWASVFSEVAPGQAFWYENSNGLLEIAVNGGSAQQQLGLSVGDQVALLAGG